MNFLLPEATWMNLKLTIEGKKPRTGEKAHTG